METKTLAISHQQTRNNYTMFRNSIELSTTYNHPVQNVWTALTNAEAMSQWLMPCDIIAQVGHKFKFRTRPTPGFDGIVNCEVLEVIENEKLSFTWTNGNSLKTIVTFQLEDLGNQTKLHFSHTGFEGLFNKLIVRKILSNGWKGKILVSQLPAYLKTIC